MYERVIDWKHIANKALNMSLAELHYAINDCAECVRLKVGNSGYYSDEASVYHTELQKRYKLLRDYKGGD